MKHIYSLFSILFAALLMAGCVNDPDIDGGIRNAKKPSVKTDEILKSTASSVTVSGEVLQENGAPVTEAGFCWSTESTFTVIEKNKKAVSKRKVKYEATIEGLTNDLDYYIRAYAINAVDTAYGEILPFKTKDGLGSVKTLFPVNVMSTSVQCGGMITKQGEAEIEERGIYLMLNPEPSASDSTIRIDMEADSFYCTISDLKPETTYYVRAYAKSKYGEYNGAKVETFKTTNGRPVLNDNKFKKIATEFTYAEFSMEIISEGDSPITACGFCFSTDKSPTIENGDTIICGAGIGEFAGKIYDMQQQKGYYVRAYATNALGTTYSAGEGIHTILESELPTVNTKEVSTIKNGTAWVGGEVLAEGASPVTEAGVCWGTSPSPAFGNCEGAVALSSGTQAFTGTIKELRGGTSYYLRAYAKNKNGIAYGEEVRFQTPDIFGVGARFEGAFRIPGSTSFCTLANSTGFLLGGDTGREYTDEFWGYMTSKKEWLPLRSQPEKLSGQACFSIGFGLWTFGGLDNTGKICDSLYVYSTSDNSWSAVQTDQQRPKGMYRTACCRMEDQAFLIGGRRGNELIDEVWTYEPSAFVWSKKSNFPIKQYGGISVVIGDRIYAGLGIINKADPSLEYTTQFWSTDKNAVAWEKEASFPGRMLLCAIAYGNYVYGVDGDGYIWRYDPDSQNWSQKSQLPAANRSVHCMYVLDNYIYIGLGNASNSLISYDPTWDN